MEMICCGVALETKKPQQKNSPKKSTPQVLSALADVSIIKRGSGVGCNLSGIVMRVGTGCEVGAAPVPNWPKALAPQQKTIPFSLAQLWPLPAVILSNTTPTAGRTIVGAGTQARPPLHVAEPTGPLPIWLVLFKPQQ